MKIARYNNFDRIDESLLDAMDVTPDDLDVVEHAKIEEFGDEDTPKRRSIVNVITEAYYYYDSNDNRSDIKSKILAAESKTDLLNLAKTFVSAIRKMQGIENDEVSPVQNNIKNLLK